MRIRAVWDGGAEGTTISQKAASKILRAQGQLTAEDKVALVNPIRFKAQTFYGFADTSGTKVDVKMTLRLTAPCGTQLPPLVVRVVPHQLDDLLVSAPDLDVLGWSRTPTAFVLGSVGISIPRTDDWSLRPTAESGAYFADAPAVARTLRCRQTVVVPAGSSMYIPVDGGELVREDSWALPCQGCLDVGLGLPEGPIAPGQQMMALVNETEDDVEIQSGVAMFSFKACDEDDLVVRRVLDGTEGELDPSSHELEEIYAADDQYGCRPEGGFREFAKRKARRPSDEELLMSFAPGVSPTTSSTSRSLSTTGGKPLRRWIMMVMALLMFLLKLSKRLRTES